MRNTHYLFIFCLSLFTAQSAIAQVKNITFRVVTYDSIPLVGAEVLIKSSKQTILTDSLGKCEVVVQPNDKLMVSAKGFFSQKLTVEENKDLILVNMKLKPGDRNANLALQNGHIIHSQRFMNARQLHNNKDLDFSQYSNFFALIDGRFPNVQVTSQEIIIRGVKSLTSSSGALIVLNGVQTDFGILSSLVPANIKSVEIVTGTPALRYGPGSGNGVMVIETKGFDN